MAAVLSSLQKMNFPTSDNLHEDSFPNEAQSSAPNSDLTYSEMVLNSLGKLSVGTYVSGDDLSVYSNMGSPRSPSSPRANSPATSMSSLFPQVYMTFEKNIALNANTKSTDCLTNLDNTIHIANDDQDMSILKKLMNTLEKFLDVDGEEDTSHFIIC